MGWLEGDVALITGGASGLGRAVALRYLAEGASVAVLDRDRDRLDAVVTAAGELADRVLPVVGDVRCPDDLHAAVKAAVDRFGKLDILVPNAGIWDYHRSVTRLSGHELAKAFDEVFAVNVKGYLLAVEAAWRELVATRGSIIMTLSNSSFHTNGGGPVYTASKHACLGLVREFAYELAPKVRVNGVACGGMRTQLRGPESLGLEQRVIADSFARNEGAGERPHIPLYDASVEPEDFTGTYVLLASRRNSGNITGAVVPVDGGIAVRGFRNSAGGADL
ncbi:3-(cis-5,6-dihydroxycyclohexa-1,3-dien-1-yl)propanoate dehydrogenase [Streptomyces himalayensis]|uniref:3-(Cis-5,6-dihydroxycyclohexa-1, 3-dien-1-yl)propanoate dehydrogenase n=1 Tax=Streptomyces himalayensis subsp. himalayensis TaxID=2756131 RepID=A0A7W0DQI9_9ACTN|nr:3-(cis-5,6-dihydroxycyclohexa-1,3-dien-1-yl)propanoate dehydrogenase [Streptomyces himalayensis]MBA2949417.1 3-(cis-5,6-dihydroxycyclohexa-1,3-dien-1-yl)propanoate dehydrogenase [Streptomyces himalayensis subsp. himalayensis]